jgi:hypothetical protein
VIGRRRRRLLDRAVPLVHNLSTLADGHAAALIRATSSPHIAAAFPHMQEWHGDTTTPSTRPDLVEGRSEELAAGALARA